MKGKQKAILWLLLLTGFTVPSTAADQGSVDRLFGYRRKEYHPDLKILGVSVWRSGVQEQGIMRRRLALNQAMALCPPQDEETHGYFFIGLFDLFLNAGMKSEIIDLYQDGQFWMRSPTVLARYKKNISVVYQDIGDFEPAIKLSEEALTVFKKYNNSI